jgi:hypothetical protein
MQQASEKADQEGLRYIEGLELDPTVHQKAVNGMGDAWRAAYAKLAEADKLKGEASSGTKESTDYPF